MMIETIRTYLGRPGAERGEVRQTFGTIYRCKKCGLTFETKQEGTDHANSHIEKITNRLRDAEQKGD